MNVERVGDGYRIERCPSGDGELVNGFLSHLKVRAFSPLTVRAYAFHVLSFLQFCDERGLELVGVTVRPVGRR